MFVTFPFCIPQRAVWPDSSLPQAVPEEKPKPVEKIRSDDAANDAARVKFRERQQKSSVFGDDAPYAQNVSPNTQPTSNKPYKISNVF